MLVDSTVKDFLAKVAGSDPVPGGGSIAALNGAIAAALAAMVAGLTVGKKGYEENEEQMQRIRTLAIRQKEEFLIDVDRDSEAYNKVFDCFRMPKSTEDEKSARSAAIQEATRFAALVPMQVARNAYELMVIIADVARLGNRNAVTDACVAMMSARSAVLGALMNVRINLGTLKDKAFVAELQAEADELERKTCEKEKELLIKVFQKIEENIQQYSVEKLSRYSNAMSGIGLSSLIEAWIVQNELTEKIYTETELLYVITELYLQICGDFRYQEHIQSICKKWIDGQTPTEINNKETIGIAEVESLCNKRISYEMNFLIGNICDLIEVDGENEEQVDQRNILTLLQKKVKYGVPNMTAISICESVFNDRLLAIELAQILSDANIGTDKILNMLKAHSEEIFSCLDSYPEYFKDRLSVLMK